MRHQRAISFTILLLIFAVSCFGAFFFWKSYENWRSSSPLNTGAHEGFGWAAGQYVIELERSRTALVLYANSELSHGELQTRLAILSSRGQILVEPSPLASNINTDSWSRETTGRLADAASVAEAATSQLLTRETALRVYQQLTDISPLAHELNVKMRQRDNQLVSDMLAAQGNLQTGFGIAATIALVCATVLALGMVRRLSIEQQLNEALRQAEKYALRNAETERRASESMRRIVNELMTVERHRTGRLAAAPVGIELVPFIERALPGALVSERLHGFKACMDAGLIEMALGSLRAIASARGHQEATVTRTSDGILVDITDDGAPLPACDDLFEPLSASSLAAGDSGVGHAAARIAVEAHGGTVEYAFTSDRNRYRITLPFRGCAA